MHNIVGFGVATVDIISHVKSYPQCDQKIRSLNTANGMFHGGGNVANTLGALQKLELSCHIISKVGNDYFGSLAMSLLTSDGVNTSLSLICPPPFSSSFSYIIADSLSKGRTCIHTPASAEMTEDDVKDNIHRWLSGDISILHFDGRHTLPAVFVAQEARRRGIPMMLDCEKHRHHLELLLKEVDYVVTNSTFFSTLPDSSMDAVGLLSSNPNIKFVITTLGEEGCIMYSTPLFYFGSDKDVLDGEGGRSEVTATLRGVEMKVSRIGGTSSYIVCTARLVAPVNSAEIVDTTGAGDTFIGGVIYSLLHKYSVLQMLSFSTNLAALKIKCEGARSSRPLSELGDFLF
jgi:sugar/nucleoside kinase (ribokinase family)